MNGDSTSEEKRSLLALRSSNHRDRTERDRRTDRAYHLLRFFGTDEETSAPPYDSNPRVRREQQINNVALTEEERKLMSEYGNKKRPGETAESFEERKRVARRQRNNLGEWKWVLEDNSSQERWEGKEDLTQTATYAVIIPSTSEDEPIKVALLDHWVEMRKHIDDEARRKQREEEALRKRLLQARLRNEEAARRHAAGETERNAEGEMVSTLKRVSFVKGRDPKQTRKRQQVDGEGVLVDEIREEEEQVDHEHELAIDRRKLEGDEFNDIDHDFQDDDEGHGELREEEDLFGIGEGGELVREAVEVDEDDFEEEDEDDGRIKHQSSSEDEEGEDEEEEEEEKEEEETPTRSISRNPVVSMQTQPQTMPQAMPQQPPAMPPQQPITGGSLEIQMKRYVAKTILDSGNMIRDINVFVREMAKRFAEKWDKKLAAQVIREIVEGVKDADGRGYFKVKDEGMRYA